MRRQLADIGRRLIDYAYFDASEEGEDRLNRFLLNGVGALDTKQKKLIALSIAVANRHGGSIAQRVHEALMAGATRPEVLECIALAVRMGGGMAASHAAHAHEALHFFSDEGASSSPHR
jgi:alkylhydroperoxidase/carboxymuconolactone decarboxylase family protein YurZ